MKYKYLIILVFGLIFGFILGCQITNRDNHPQNTKQIGDKEKTEIIKYKQKYVPTKNEKGYCWTISIATPSNERAWKCFVGNFIHDPCFETEDGKIVCDVDPEVGGSGFELKLTKDLPLREGPFLEIDQPWLVKFDNGIICGAITGSAGFIGEDSFHYSCDKEAVILGEINTDNPIWTAMVGYPTKDYESLAKEENLEIIKVWK